MDKDIFSHELVKAFMAKASDILPAGSTLSLYGSRARGDSRPDSDWDLHILVPGAEQLPLALYDVYAWPFEMLGFEYNQEVNARFYSYAGWKKRCVLPFYKNVETDKIVLYKN